MTDEDTLSDRQMIDRRTTLKTSGLLAVGSIAALAGCADDDPADDDDTMDDEDDVVDDDDDDDDNDVVDDDEDDEDDDDVVDDDEDDNDDADVDTAEWEDVDEIELEGLTENWVGVSPDPIDGEENPTLVLFEGESYDITWENGDGAQHNIEIWDENDEVVDDYETELMDEEGETQTLEIEASDEMAQYVCEPHQGTMRGDIQIEMGDNGDDNDTDEDADDENDNDNDNDEDE